MKVYKSERKAKNRIMRYLEPQEKIRSRALYEEMFTEDEKSFVDAYYAYKAPYNRILAIEEEQLYRGGGYEAGIPPSGVYAKLDLSRAS